MDSRAAFIAVVSLLMDPAEEPEASLRPVTVSQSVSPVSCADRVVEALAESWTLRNTTE